MTDANAPDDDAGSLGGYLTGDGNCWGSTVAGAATCLPPGTERGTVSADGRTCTYASGTVVTFDDPLTMSGNGPWNFTVTSDGKSCLRFAAPTLSETLTTSAGTVSLTVMMAPGSLSITCPDGTTHSGSATSLSGCVNSVPGVGVATGSAPQVAGAGDAGGAWSVSLSLASMGDSSDLFAFRCASQP